MERGRLDVHEACTHLRRAARSSGRELPEVAREVAVDKPCHADDPDRPAQRRR
jgi:hypothetical protein